MHLKVAAVGQRMPRWVSEAWDEYAKRLPAPLGLKLIEIPLARRGRGADVGRARQQEGEALLAAVPPGACRVALDIGGTPWSTEQLARNLEQWMAGGRDVWLIVGGPDGLSDDLPAQCEHRWSLGPLTLSHSLARIIVVEQLYRAWSIVNRHPYHRP